MTPDHRTCTEPGCDRPRYARSGLCRQHDERVRSGRPITGPITTDPPVIGGDVFMPCPESVLELADWCADNDARNIVRAIWPHLLEASLAGLEPFTLRAVS